MHIEPAVGAGHVHARPKQKRVGRQIGDAADGGQGRQKLEARQSLMQLLNRFGKQLAVGDLNLLALVDCVESKPPPARFLERRVRRGHLSRHIVIDEAVDENEREGFCAPEPGRQRRYVTEIDHHGNPSISGSVAA